MLLVDRLSRDDGPAPLAVVVHDAANRQMLSRVFVVKEQTLVLSAVSSGAVLAPTALDPALVKVAALLTPSGVG